MITYEREKDGTLKQVDSPPKRAELVVVGTCRNEGDQKDFLCSGCGTRMFIDTGDTYTMIDSLGNIIEQPNYCPNCGARVVEVDE